MLDLGHLARDFPLEGCGKGNNRASGPKHVSFEVCRGGAGATTAFMTLSSLSPSAVRLSIYAGVAVRGCEALVDTAAEDAVVGH